MSKKKKILVTIIVVMCLSIYLSISVGAIDIMSTFSPTLYLQYTIPSGVDNLSLGGSTAEPITFNSSDRLEIICYQSESFGVTGGFFDVSFSFYLLGNVERINWILGTSRIYTAVPSSTANYTIHTLGAQAVQNYSVKKVYEPDTIALNYRGATRVDISFSLPNNQLNSSGIAMRFYPDASVGSYSKLLFTGFDFDYLTSADYATVHQIDNEKSEARQSSNGSLDSASEAVPDKSTGFLAPYQTLVNSMSYSGTDCELQFPSIFIPQIGDVLPEAIPLLESQTIDFSEAIDCIPSSILSLIRAVFDVVLVIFCGKEFYSLLYGLFSGFQKGDDG